MPTRCRRPTLTLLGAGSWRCAAVVACGRMACRGRRERPAQPRTASTTRTTWRRSRRSAAGRASPRSAGVDQRLVGHWAASMIAAGQAHQDQQSTLSAASAYWRWLRKRGHTEADPFAGATIAKGRATPKQAALHRRRGCHAAGGRRWRRAWRRDARSRRCPACVSRKSIDSPWWTAPPTGLTCALQRTPAGVRRVPIHSALTAIVERRCAARRRPAYLIHEAGPAPRAGRERSYAGKPSFRPISPARWRA